MTQRLPFAGPASAVVGAPPVPHLLTADEVAALVARVPTEDLGEAVAAVGGMLGARWGQPGQEAANRNRALLLEALVAVILHAPPRLVRGHA